jgi:hypothetical protein
MAIVSYMPEHTQSRCAMRAVIKYVSQDHKINDGVNSYISGINCTPSTAFEEFMLTKKLYEKATGTFFYHYVQSFHTSENVTPQLANEIGVKFAEQQFKDHEVVVATHIDREHIHNHFVINSVHTDTGKKLRQTPHSLEEHRKASDIICQQFGLSTLQPYVRDYKVKGVSGGEYRAAERGNSWKFQLMFNIDECMKKSRSKADFLRLMKNCGYQIGWNDNRKNITYTTPTNFKCRDYRLHELKYLKENMENEFKIRQIQAGQQFGYERSYQHRESNNGIREELVSLDTDDRQKLGLDDRSTTEPRPTVNRRENDEISGYRRTQDGISTDPNAGQGEFDSIENGDFNERLHLTGWEDERAILYASESDDGCDEKLQQENVLDNVNIPSIVSGGISLAHNLSKIIDDTPRHSSRQKTKHSSAEKEKRKALGQKDEVSDEPTWHQKM